MNSVLETLENKRILILGFGKEGQSTYQFLRKHFPDKTVAIADRNGQSMEFVKSDKNIIFHVGDEYITHLKDYDIIIKSPGIPKSLPELHEAEKQGVKILSQTKLFFEICSQRIIGVTGTKGKSTTASLIYSILKSAGNDVVLLGNIGAPALDYFDDDTPNRWYVFELSSHQLSDLSQSPHIAVFLNIFSEHLDYYKSFDKYLEAKANITKFQTEKDYFIFNAEQKELSNIAKSTKGKAIEFFPSAMSEVIRFENEDIIPFSEVPLLGKMNRNNVMAAVIVGKILNIKTETIREAIKKFKPLEYRLELVGTYKGISFYDDALATIPEATIAALESVPSPVGTLIAGGFDRGQDFQKLAKAIIDHHIETILLFPTTGERIWKEIEKISPNEKPNHFFVSTMEEAVKLSYEYTKSGTICLLSCASPSFGIFKDYNDRSEQYRKYVKEMGEEAKTT